jgi:hypothetical protein
MNGKRKGRRKCQQYDIRLIKFEVGTFIGLGDVFDVEFGVAAVVAGRGGFPGGAAGG